MIANQLVLFFYSLLWYPRDTGVFFSSSFDCTCKVWDTNQAKPVVNIAFQDKVLGGGLECLSLSLISSKDFKVI